MNDLPKTSKKISTFDDIRPSGIGITAAADSDSLSANPFLMLTTRRANAIPLHDSRGSAKKRILWRLKVPTSGIGH